MNWLSWQIDYLLLLQNFRDVTGGIFDNLFLHITIFGEVIIPMLFICAIYWCVNKQAGIYILWNYMFGFITNMFLKCTACVYRPWILDSRIHPIESALPAATGYSFPSGHTAGAVSVWGGSAVAFWKNKILRYSLIILVLLIGFSRNYIGVHTPQDVIVSLFVGAFLLWCTQKLMNWVYNDRESGKRDLLTVVSVSLISILILLYVNLKWYPTDYLNGKLLFDTTHVKIDAFARVGMIIGTMCGWIIEKRFVNFETGNVRFLKNIFRFCIGIGFLYLLYSFDTELRSLLFIQYFTAGIFITLIYPYIMKKYV